MWVKFNPYRVVRGTATVGNLAANFSIVGLFNNDPGYNVLAVLDVSCPQGTGNIYQAGTSQGIVGAGVASSSRPLWPDRGALGGQICTSQQAALPAFADWVAGLSGNDGKLWGHDFPIAIVPPGFTFWLTGTAVNSTVQVAFVWQVLEQDELTHVMTTRDHALG